MKLSKEVKKKIMIEQLIAQNNHKRWEYSQYMVILFGVVAMLVAIFIPIMIYLGGYIFPLITGFCLIILILFAHRIINFFGKKNLEFIDSNSKKIQKLYEGLLE